MIMDRTLPVSSAHFACKWALALLAMLTLAMTGAAGAAGGSYDEEDPFDEHRLFERFQRLGGDLTQEQDVEFQFTFSDRFETRAELAQRFANKLRRMGYTKAKAQPCGDEKFCWLVIAPKRMRLDLKKNIALSKQLDQLAADDYGRYDGWDCELFSKEDDMMRGRSFAGPNKVVTLGVWLKSFDQVVTLQCSKMRESLAASANAAEANGKRHEAFAARGMLDMMCTCVPERLAEVRYAAVTLDMDDAPITEAELTQTYVMPKIIQPCAAKMIRKSYSEECPTLAAGQNLNAETYCSCMQQLVGEMSEADLAQLGLITSDYLPQVAQAQKNGASPPDPPPLYAKFAASEAACRK
jgi:hypothetical protein